MSRVTTLTPGRQKAAAMSASTFHPSSASRLAQPLLQLSHPFHPHSAPQPVCPLRIPAIHDKSPWPLYTSISQSSEPQHPVVLLPLGHLSPLYLRMASVPGRQSPFPPSSLLYPHGVQAAKWIDGGFKG